MARQLLGVPEDLVEELFEPWNIHPYRPEPEDITPKMAADVLKNWALTGKVEWPDTDLLAKAVPRM